MKNISLLLILFCFLWAIVGCDENPADPKPTTGDISGSVKTSEVPVYPAWIFIDDSLITTTNEAGHYSISDLQEGSYQILCSALNFRDTTAQVQVTGGKTVTHDYVLTPDLTTGKMYGEFQDLTLFNEMLVENPELADWSPVDIWSGVTGATLQTKTLKYKVPERRVFLGDSVLAYADDFAQFWTRIQCGTYLLQGTCEGYQDDFQVIKVFPDSSVYVNFYLPRN